MEMLDRGESESELRKGKLFYFPEDVYKSNMFMSIKFNDRPVRDMFPCDWCKS